MSKMQYGSDYKKIPAYSKESGKTTEVLTDLCTYTNKIVNIHMVGDPGKGDFVLVDAGFPDSSDEIIKAVEERFGEGSRPKAIILTHGHFDHVGSIIELIERWDVKVYAHQLEMPYLSGQKPYPKPDPAVEGGMMAKMSAMFPREPVDLGGNVEALPADGTVPYMQGFEWIHTPGHTKGHVSLYRAADGTLIAGDAFVTVQQDSLYKTMVQKKEIQGPPVYYTTDWEMARASVEKLASIEPETAVTGHGKALKGEELRHDLEKLVNNFEEIAVPSHGRYVEDDD
ncbi:Glyoxylase, beta-lactamase superfamily II [Salinicoccus halodurans]|uniref:Glyoxylase, beta-lactamase superfamily II n=2 Tax=Salinicoccus halodurans TaxID=407035 RepID=A0A0F7D4U8_9STAP|nr:metallo-beta-lactamase family protein [Salinicoccus halodurans]SFK69335.1 Glyoxylase, beta-lactamase superfamily II [Salinicoccus halodurans]